MNWLRRRRSGIAFFALGFVVAALCAWLVGNWYEIANEVFGLSVTYDTRATWLRGLMVFLTWAPWVLLAAFIVVRVIRGPVVRPLAYGLGAVSVYVVLVGSLFFGPALSQRLHRRTFDPAGWARNERADVMWPARLAMVDDLLAKHPLVGLGTDSLERLLGPRDSTSHFRDWDYVYWLGPERGMLGIDSEWLVVRVGKDGRVTDRRIVRD